MNPPVCEATVMLLGETHPPVAAALAAAGCTGDGYPNIGLLGWLPVEDRLAVARAAVVAHHQAGTGWPHDCPTEVAWLITHGSWRLDEPEYVVRCDAAVVAYAQARGVDPDVWRARCVEARK